ALAGLRMLALLGDDWRAVDLARRARGLGDRRGPVRLAGQAFALLVLAIRRATLLATAMESRGFPAQGPRTWARESTLGRADAVLIGLGAAVALTALAVSLGTGSWRFAGG
ncbi:MAG: energy-coupling factor transporter transmembrane protein EcfT, partial [Micrococcales bacterium]|nr:energy-coupling factor transporter transmembrane protein EcfT [Micrococcales bacterium]